MKQWFVLALFFSALTARAQHPAAHQSLVLTAGWMHFSTGRVNGYSIGTQYAWGLTQRVSMSGEAFAEEAHQQPVLDDAHKFYQVSNVGITVRLHYYPFAHFLKGLTLAGGPAFGHQSSTTEARSETRFDLGQPPVRQSVLQYDNNWFAGYRVSLNYNLPIKSRFVFGGRAEFSQYSNGDINTMIGLRGGVKF